MRRSRFRPTPGNPYHLTPHDINGFTALGIHQVLPAPYLHAFTGRANLKSSIHRFTVLTHGYAFKDKQIAHLARPVEQKLHFNALNQPCAYTLTDHSEKELKERGIPYVKRGGWFIHQLMGGAIGGSFHLAADRVGTFIPRFPLINTTFALPSYVPDDLFGIEYPDGSKRVFVREDDRGTESIAGKSLEATYVGQKLIALMNVIKDRTYLDHWHTKGLMALICTTLQSRADSLKELVHKHDPRLAKHLLFKVFPDFQKDWHMPPIYSDILTEWQRPDGSTFDLSRP